jgi:hypothetical protein
VEQARSSPLLRSTSPSLGSVVSFVVCLFGNVFLCCCLCVLVCVCVFCVFLGGAFEYGLFASALFGVIAQISRYLFESPTHDTVLVLIATTMHQHSTRGMLWALSAPPIVSFTPLPIANNINNTTNNINNHITNNINAITTQQPIDTPVLSSSSTTTSTTATAATKRSSTSTTSGGIANNYSTKAVTMPSTTTTAAQVCGFIEEPTNTNTNTNTTTTTTTNTSTSLL